ncbi:hypothetical protein O181_089433 [Austropuccinia psidii MF-1]|uniref:Uncharacterized protein n=1 Tax=Austropuccinia psidii MF-1 TaxID=1389203 RepID=A0A9Q3ITH3_9BASI|nr:hypothetical protein [Austropuccinia psidii MF-1]
MIGWTQHRRVVGMLVAARVADKMGIQVEDAIRTEPDLAGYAPMRIDSSNEHTIAPDILLGLFKDIACYWPDLCLLISSATMNSASFGECFNYAPIFNITARMPPVDIQHTPPTEANHMHAVGFCAAADQCAGQAGRVAPGRGFQLYSKWAYMKELAEDKVPEIQRTILDIR